MNTDTEKATATDDPKTEADIVDENREQYYAHCQSAGIEVEADDRKARVGFIFQ